MSMDELVAKALYDAEIDFSANAEVWPFETEPVRKRLLGEAAGIINMLDAAGLVIVNKRCVMPLTNGGATLLSEEDFDRVTAAGKWFAVEKASGLYVVRSFGKNNPVYLHRYITDAPKGSYVDHINGDTLDNRRGNLRVVTQRENQRNRSGAQANSASGIRGVYWHKQRSKWAAAIRQDGKKISLGLFNDIADAAKARADAERLMWGYADRYRAMIKAASE